LIISWKLYAIEISVIKKCTHKLTTKQKKKYYVVALVKLVIRIERKRGIVYSEIVICRLGLFFRRATLCGIEPYKTKTKIIGLLSSSYMTDRLYTRSWIPIPIERSLARR
jgi:hypothetical protein